MGSVLSGGRALECGCLRGPALLARPQFYASKSSSCELVIKRGSGFIRVFVHGPRRMPPEPPRTGRRRRSKSPARLNDDQTLSDGKWRCPPPTTSEQLHPHLAAQAVDAEQLSQARQQRAAQGPPAWGSPCTCGAASYWRRRLTAPRRTPARARLRGPARAANASSALVLKDRRLPAPTSRALVARRRLSYNYVEKLTASDAALYDQLGNSMAVDGATLVVGARGGDDIAYVFRTTDGGATYVEVAKLTASDAGHEDNFGWSVAIAGDSIVVGARYDDDGGTSSGAVYVFRTSDGGATYSQVAKLTASDAASQDYFGWSVAIDGATIVVGARYDDDGGSQSGSAYVFHTTDGGATYGQVAKLTASDAAAGDEFGYSVAIEGDTVVIGAYGDYYERGSVYVFRTSDGGATYSQVAKLTASDAAAGD